MILNSSQIRAIEQKEFRLRENSFSLMQSAGEKCADFFFNCIPKSKDILVVCGPGNNGGDGFIIGKSLIDNGYKVRIFLILNLKNKKNDNSKALKYLDYKVLNLSDLNRELKKKTKPIIIDCIFGTGLNKKVSTAIKRLIRAINIKKTQWHLYYIKIEK